MPLMLVVQRKRLRDEIVNAAVAYRDSPPSKWLDREEAMWQAVDTYIEWEHTNANGSGPSDCGDEAGLPPGA